MGTVVIPPHRLDWRDGGQRRDGFRAVDVAGVDEEIDASKHLEQSVRQAIEELRAVMSATTPMRVVCTSGFSLNQGALSGFTVTLDKLASQRF
jgi:hypothetical protein